LQLTTRNLALGAAALAIAIVVAPMAHGQSPQPPIGDRIVGFLTGSIWRDDTRQARWMRPSRRRGGIDVKRHFALAHDLEALIQFIRSPDRIRLNNSVPPYSVDEQLLLKRLAFKERLAGTTDSLLRQVALLESDALMLTGGERYVVVPPGSGIPRDMILSMDGVNQEAVATPPNWQIARSAIGACRTIRRRWRGRACGTRHDRVSLSRIACWPRCRNIWRSGG
jgi:hypothetical protein